MEKAHKLTSFKELGTMFNLNNGAELTRATKGGMQRKEGSIPEAPTQQELERRNKRFESTEPASRLIDAIVKDAQARKVMKPLNHGYGRKRIPEYASSLAPAQFNATHGISHLHEQETMPEDGILRISSMPENNRPEQAKVVPIDIKIPPQKVEARPSAEGKENEQILKIIEGQVAHWEQKLLHQSTDEKNPNREQNRQDYLDFQLSPYGWLKETLEQSKKIPHRDETLRALNMAFKKGLGLPLEHTEDMGAVFPAVGTQITEKEIVDTFNRKLRVQSSTYTVEKIFQRRNDQFVTLQTNEGKKFEIKIEDYNWETRVKEQEKLLPEKKLAVETVDSTPGVVTETTHENETIEDNEFIQLFNKLSTLAQEIKEIQQKENPVQDVDADVITGPENTQKETVGENYAEKRDKLAFIKKTFNKGKEIGSEVLHKTSVLKDSIKNSALGRMEKKKQKRIEKHAQSRKEITKKDQEKKMHEVKEELEKDMVKKPISYFAFGMIKNNYIRDILINPQIGSFDMRGYDGNNKYDHDIDKPYDVKLKEIQRITNKEGVVVCNTIGVAMIATNLDPSMKIPGDSWNGERMYKRNFKIIATDPTNGEAIITQNLDLQKAIQKYGEITKWVFQVIKKRYEDSIQA